MFSLIHKIPEGGLDGWYRWLTIFAILLPVVGAVLGGLSGYAAYLVGDRVSVLKDAAISKLEASRKPRHLSEEQRAKLLDCLPKGPKGGVTITLLGTEPDAPELAAEIASVLNKSGSIASVSNKIWLRLKLDGILYGIGLTRHRTTTRDIYPELLSRRGHSRSWYERPAVLCGIPTANFPGQHNSCNRWSGVTGQVLGDAELKGAAEFP